jgi:CSLREA domain-containing protein
MAGAGGSGRQLRLGAGVAAWVLLAGALVAGVAAPAGASTATVTKLADTDGTCDAGDCSLREAINSGADLITFASGVSGVMDLFEQLPALTVDVTIQGPGAGTLSIRRQSGEFFRIFTVEGGVTAEISGLTIWNGGATPGGGVLAGSALQNSTLTLRNVVVTGNSGGSGGGVASYGTLTVESSTIEHNTATTTGGGGGILSFGALTVRNSTVANNTAPNNGGGIRVRPPSQPLPGATATVERSTITENNGGGIRNTGADLTITETTVSGNQAPVGGGVGSSGTLLIERSTLSGNSSCNQYSGGGGLAVSGGQATVRNSTISGNDTCSHGGGIDVYLTGSLTLTNSTVAANESGVSGANLGVRDADAQALVRSSILANPLGGTNNCAALVDGVITSQGYNLADDASCGFNAPADQPVANALLAPLGDNGGPTQTMALGEASPAIDQGISGGLTTDQRGMPRPVDFADIPNAPGGDGTDIGAFEVADPDADPGEPGDPEATEACPDDLPSGGFTDTTGNLHAHNIDCIVWWEITFGIAPGQYGPTNPVTRAQMASFIARLIENAGGTLPAPSDQGFTDIAGNTHADRINQLAAAGVVQGTSPTTYNPAAAVRRDQMTTFLVRAYHHLTGATLPVTQTYFNDIAGNVHEDNINAAAEAGFALGTGPGTFSPLLDVRRDQMASFLARVLERLVDEGHTDPPT